MFCGGRYPLYLRIGRSVSCGVNQPVAEEAETADRARSRILAAALKEFGAHGFHGARIEAIARRARVPRGLIAYYFSTREGRFQALARNRADAIERTQIGAHSRGC